LTTKASTIGCSKSTETARPMSSLNKVNNDPDKDHQHEPPSPEEAPSSPSSLSSQSLIPPISLVSTCEEMNPSKRSSFEDCSIYAPAGSWNAPDANMAFLSVVDGHGGRSIVEYLEDGLLYHVSQELQQQQQQQQQQHNDGTTGNTELISSAINEESSILASLERAFLMADIHSKALGVTSSGATVAVCLVTRGNTNTNDGFDNNNNNNNKSSDPAANNYNYDNTWTIHAANAGDARVVLSHEGEAFRMTHDHRTDDPEEVKRIEESGGFIFKGRVLGVLAVTRSLGDHCMKEYVIASPYTSNKTITITPDANNKASFIIVGCDGLWDVMQDQEAVDFVLKRITEKELVAKYLVEEALKRGSTDNITVSVAFLT
jgi:serine/threonine protein phosphatase PrpC